MKLNISTADRIKIWKDFRKRWKLQSSLEYMKLENYSNLKKANSPGDYFTYWLEHTTAPLGYISGSTARIFGIYKTKKDKSYKWNKNLNVDNEKKAFSLIKKRIIDVVKYTKKGNFKEIDGIELAPVVKWKIAFLYQDMKYPKIVNIFSKSVLEEYVASLGHNNTTNKKIYELYELAFKNQSTEEMLDATTAFFKRKNGIEEPTDYNGDDRDRGNKKEKCTIERYIRDTALSKKIKNFEQNKCQLCNKTIYLPSGRAFSEAHHIRPLGKGHKGRDRQDNIIIVCPTCHAKLDYLAIPIEFNKIIQRKPSKHSISNDFVEYHNKIYKEEKSKWLKK